MFGDEHDGLRSLRVMQQELAQQGGCGSVPAKNHDMVHEVFQFHIAHSPSIRQSPSHIRTHEAHKHTEDGQAPQHEGERRGTSGLGDGRIAHRLSCHQAKHRVPEGILKGGQGTRLRPLNHPCACHGERKANGDETGELASRCPKQ